MIAGTFGIFIGIYSNLTDVNELASKEDLQRIVRLANARWRREDPAQETLSRPPGIRLDTRATLKRVFEGAVALYGGDVKCNLHTVARLPEDSIATKVASMRSKLEAGIRTNATTCGMNCLRAFMPQVFFLELGCGTKSWSRLVERLGLQDVIIIITVDIDATRNPTWTADITQWNKWFPDLIVYMKAKYPHFVAFDIVHFSPECTEISASKTSGVRDIDKALHLVQSGLALLLHIAPSIWTIECSASGKFKLATHKLMAGLNARKLPTCNFCKACGLGNWKPGDWWTNIPERYRRELVPSCKPGQQCTFKIVNGVHKATSQNGAAPNGTSGMSRDACMAFPDLLVDRWLNAMVLWLWESEPERIAPDA